MLNIQFFQQIGWHEWGSLFLYILGILFLYHNRFQLLYEKGSISLSRTWTWILFYLAVAFWIRYLTGLIPTNTAFPPGLESMLYAALLYEFAKQDSGAVSRIVDIIVSKRYGNNNQDYSPWTPGRWSDDQLIGPDYQKKNPFPEASEEQLSFSDPKAPKNLGE